MYKGRIEQNLNQLNIPNVIQSDPQYEELCGKRVIWDGILLVLLVVSCLKVASFNLCSLEILIAQTLLELAGGYSLLQVKLIAQ